jgi:hypothetical protein
VEDPPWSEILRGHDRDPLTALIEAQEGVVARWQARRFLSDKAIRHRVASGRWRRVHRAVFYTYGGIPSLPQRHWVAVLAASTEDRPLACLGGITAMQVLGLRTITGKQVDVVADREISPPPGVVVHRVRLAEEDRHPSMRPPITMPGRSVVDAAAWAGSDDEARLVIAASMQQRLVTAAEIWQVLDRLPTTHRRRLVTETVRDAAGGSHTLAELLLVKICRNAGLPIPDRQVGFRDTTGRRRYLDAVFDRWRVAVEVDGAHHDDVRQRWDDMERENAIVLAGYRVLRFPSHVVRNHPDEVAATLTAALEREGWRPEIARR